MLRGFALAALVSACAVGCDDPRLPRVDGSAMDAVSDSATMTDAMTLDSARDAAQDGSLATDATDAIVVATSDATADAQDSAVAEAGADAGADAWTDASATDVADEQPLVTDASTDGG